MGVYAASFALWIPLALQQYVWLTPLAVGATVLTPLVEAPNVTSTVKAEARQFRIAGEDPATGRTYGFTVDAHPFSHGVPVLVALAAAAPDLTLVLRVRIVAVALLPLFAFNLVLLLCAVENTYMGISAAVAPAFDRTFAPLFRAGTDASEAFFGQFVGIVVAFGVSMTLALRRHAQDDPVGPNDPCPCGSGLKRKRCCAR